MHGGRRAAEVEPVGLGHVALADGEKTRETRFRREQVVTRDIQPAFPVTVGQPETDAEQVPANVIQRPEVHLVEQRAGTSPRSRRRAAVAGATVAAVRQSWQTGRERQERAGEIPAVHGGHVPGSAAERAWRSRTS